jgi:hypothetical protein
VHQFIVNNWILGSVIPAQKGILCRNLDSRLRGNDELFQTLNADTLEVVSKPGLAPVAQKQSRQILPLQGCLSRF